MMKRGFTLIELLVSTAVFTIVMVVALGALLSLSEANRKADILNSSINNLSFALDSMSRALRTGTNYHCTSGGILAEPKDCGAGGSSGITPGTYLTFLDADGIRVTYRFDNAQDETSLCGQTAKPYGCIERSVNGGAFLPLTMPEVIVTNLSFYVTGAEPKNAASEDTTQPKVTILLNAYTSVKATQKSVFSLQTSVTQRIYDL